MGWAPAIALLSFFAFRFSTQQGRARFASEGGGPNEDRPDPPPANQMIKWLFKYYVTALPGGSAPPP